MTVATTKRETGPISFPPKRLTPLLIAALLAACSAGTVDTTTMTELVTTTTESTTTTAPTTTTTAPTTTTTEALAEFPAPRENLEHGGDAWAVVLAASTGFSDPALVTAELDAEAAGYRTGATDCDQGVAQALGLPEDEHYYSVSVYFESEADANQARDAFYARGIGATVALLQTYCLD